MGLSAGPGSPVWLRCPVARRNRTRDGHVLTRTGRWRRRYRSGALGVRSLQHEHEYVCSCGHQGWTNHIDVLDRPGPDLGSWCPSYHCGAPAAGCELPYHQRKEASSG